MWRTTTVTLVAAVLLALTAGAALAVLAATIECPNADRGSGGYDCEGTPDGDTMNGTSGPDYMAGFAGEDTLNGFDGDDKIDALNDNDYDYVTETLVTFNDKSKDTVSGGPGNDTIAANDGFKDHIYCGTGSRDIAYTDKGKDMVSSDCEWRRSYDIPLHCHGYNGPPWTEPSQPGDWPDPVPEVRGKTIWCIDGTPRDNKKLHGTTGQSDLLDSIWADKGNDTLNGGLGPDSLQGWSGNDILKGGAGTDFLYGDSSENPIDAHGFFKGAGEDKISGGPGDDFISAIDNKMDTISCGGGTDVVQRDKSGETLPDTTVRSTVTDKVAKDCEREEISSQPEESLFWCRRYGHRKRH
jgi:Ca2+-binding RTX toxin-like protein